MSTEPQGSPKWKALRYCAITSSMIVYTSGRGNPRWTPEPEELARQICGLSEKTFTEEQIHNMQRGTTMEPHLREWDEKKKGVPIKEVGIGVWKKDPRFRGSMDGEIDSDDFVEYKVPKKMYWLLIQRMENRSNRSQGDYSHIFPSHYDQIISNGVIHGKKRCCYTVLCSQTCNYYQEWIPIDHNHWNNILYPRSCLFYETYITPLMKTHNLKLVIPPDLESDQ